MPAHRGDDAADVGFLVAALERVDEVELEVVGGAMALSQNAAMASLPWWPLPSGSKNDGPMGSCTIASSAKFVQPGLACPWRQPRPGIACPPGEPDVEDR